MKIIKSISRIGLLLSAALVLGACSSNVYKRASETYDQALSKSLQAQQATGRQSEPKVLNIPDVPFFEQEENQCGANALATLLSFRGEELRPEDLRPYLYVPDKKGSYQTELVALSRQYNVLPYARASNLNELVDATAAQDPNLLLLNLGLPSHPVWHYAVVVALEQKPRKIILHSGKSKPEEMSLKRFEYAWRNAGYWALSLHDFDQLPKYANSPWQINAAIADVEGMGNKQSAEIAYGASHRLWPDQAAPLVGMGNIAYSKQRFSEAAEYFQHALALSDNDWAIIHNWAWAEFKLGNKAKALSLLQQALTGLEDEDAKDRLEKSLHAMHSQ